VANEPSHGLHPERTGDQASADQRVQQDELPLGPGDLARVAEDRAGDRDVAHVAQMHGVLDLVDLRLRHLEATGDGHRQRRHVLAGAHQPQCLDRVRRGTPTGAHVALAGRLAGAPSRQLEPLARNRGLDRQRRAAHVAGDLEAVTGLAQGAGR
jgi:hypothetical protein